MSDHRFLRTQLEGDLRQAIENMMGDEVSGPWTSLIAELARMLHDGSLDLDRASRMAFLLARTGDTSPEECPTCICPEPGMDH